MQPVCYQQSATVPLNYDANGMPAEGPDQECRSYWRCSYMPEVPVEHITLTLTIEDQHGL